MPEDPRELAQRQFAGEPDNAWLDILSAYATDPPVAVATILEAARPERPHALVCELGFGNGWLVKEMVGAFPDAALYGLDQSSDFIELVRRELGASVRLLRGDMEAQPFVDGVFDCVVTCWTLYFMRDIDATLEEIRRTLRPGGKVVAATVAPDHMREYEDITRAVSRDLGVDASLEDVGLRFDLASGHAYFKRAFPGYELREWRGELALPDVETLLRFWEPAHRRLIDINEAVRESVRRHATPLFASDGRVHITRHDGLFIGYKR